MVSFEDLSLTELKEIAGKAGINVTGMKKAEIVTSLYQVAEQEDGEMKTDSGNDTANSETGAAEENTSGDSEKETAEGSELSDQCKDEPEIGIVEYEKKITFKTFITGGHVITFTDGIAEVSKGIAMHFSDIPGFIVK